MAVAALILGFGWAHETLRHRGIGERALGWVCEPVSSELTWWVEEHTSMIVLTGQPADIQSAASTVVDRIVAGPATLPTLKFASQPDPDGPLLRLRYGHQGYGVAAALRYGYRTADAADVGGWLGRVGGHSFLTVTGDVELKPARLAEVVPLPQPSRELMVSVPGAWVSGDGFGVSWLAPKTSTARVATQVMIAAIRSVIPVPAPGLANVQVTRRSIGADTDHVSVVSTERIVPSAQVVEILQALDRLQLAGPDPAEVVSAIDQQDRDADDPGFPSALAQARQQLLHSVGYRVPPPEELNADPGALVAQISAHCQTLLMTCGEHPPAQLLPASRRREAGAPAVGRTFRASRLLVGEGLNPRGGFVVSDTAVTFRGTEPVTVTADTLALVERFPDGERTLYDVAGQELHIDPWLWANSTTLIGWVDQHSRGLEVDREGALAASPYVTRAALRARPGFALAGAGIAAVSGIVLLIVAVVGSEDRLFPLFFGLLLVAAAVALGKLVQVTVRMRRRAGV